MKMVKIGSFWHNLVSKCRHMSNFWESGPIILSLKVSKNYFSQIYGQKCAQKCHKWGQFGQNRSFLVKMVKIGSFWGPKCRNLGKLLKYFSP